MWVWPFLAAMAVAAVVVAATVAVWAIFDQRSSERLEADERAELVRQVQVQTVANEVEVLRHRVHSKEGDLRLCTIALGASRPVEVAERICTPVLGDEYWPTKAKLAAEEARLEKLRAAR